jgi:hypothetical protein
MNIMHEWFVYLFDERKDEQGYVRCFECGKRMHEDTYKHLTTCYSHILPKGVKKYAHLAGDEDNIAIVHPSCHNLYEATPRLAVNQWKKRLELLEKLNN